jgi:hypothetical protein
MPHEKSRPMTLRLRRDTDDALDALAAELRLDRSNTLRFLVHEKARALGILPSGAAKSASERAAVESVPLVKTARR